MSKIEAARNRFSLKRPSGLDYDEAATAAARWRKARRAY
jgi:hypothetical protein